MDIGFSIKKIIQKVILAAILGTINSVAFCPTCFSDPREPNERVLLYYFLVFLFTMEFMSVGVRLICEKFDWIREPRKIVIANLLWLILLYAPINYLAVELNFRHHPDRFTDVIIYGLKRNNMLLAIIILLYLNSVRFFSSWKESILKEEKMKALETRHELKALKNQINPHFLFNNLNTLSHLVKEDSVLAEKYIYQLSTVYRYLLEQKNEDLVLLVEELVVLKALIYILEVKHLNNLIFNINETHFAQFKVATFTLQMLVENAVKHNVIDQSNKLTIDIFIDKNNLIVRNNITKRPNIAYSSGIGLSNIIARYKLLAEHTVEVMESENYFEVKIPVLK